MSGAEMTIRLVDGSEAEQAAFDRQPDAETTGGVPSIGGVDSPNAARSDTVEAITAGFASIGDKATKDDFQHDSTASVAAVHEQLAAIANGKQDDKPTHYQSDPSEAKEDGPTSEDYRGFRLALEQLTQRFTPKFFSDPIDRLIAFLASTVQTSEKDETQPGSLPVETTENSAPIIPAVGHVAPKQDEGGDSKPTADNKPATVPAVGHVAPKQDEGGDSKPTADNKPATVPAVGHVAPKADEKQTDAPKSVSVNDIVSKVQQRIAKIPVVGKRINGAINSVRSTVQKYQGGLTKVAKSITGTIGKTKAGRSFLAAGSKLASKITGSSFGKAVGGAGRFVVGAVARTVGASAAGGAVVSGGAGTAATVAASGTTAAAGGAAPAVAAGAALLANPVGLAVGAVVASFAALALATKALNDTFSSEADRLEKYSASISIARGNKQINTELNMMDRAKKIDGPLGSLETSKAKLNDQMEKLWTDVLVILSKLEPVVEMGVDFLSVMAAEARKAIASTEVAAANAASFAAKLTQNPFDDIAAAAFLKAATDHLKTITDKQKEANDRIDGNDPNGDDPFLIALLNAKF